jgi:hypothetical protein
MLIALEHFALISQNKNNAIGAFNTEKGKLSP